MEMAVLWGLFLVAALVGGAHGADKPLADVKVRASDSPVIENPGQLWGTPRVGRCGGGSLVVSCQRDCDTLT